MMTFKPGHRFRRFPTPPMGGKLHMAERVMRNPYSTKEARLKVLWGINDYTVPLDKEII